MKDMSYEVFCTYIKNAVEQYYGEDIVVKLHSVQKVNGVILQGITIGKKEQSIMPTIYLEQFYERYLDGMELYKVVCSFIEEYERAEVNQEFDIDFFTDYEKVKPYLGYKLLHYEMNRKLLESVPHKRYYDLVIVCYCSIMDERIGAGTILVKNEHLNMWNKIEDEVIKDAMANMQSIFPAEFMAMKEVLKEMYSDPAYLLEDIMPMYVLTNKQRMFGAASILYKGQMERIAQMLQDDFYILPSSIHEVIILAKKYGTDEEYLSHMVQEINQEHLNREEVLSNHAYLYSRQIKKLIPLPLIPNKKNGS